MKGCMTQKGYMLVPADQAEAMREQFAATAAQRAVMQNPPVPEPAPTKKKKLDVLMKRLGLLIAPKPLHSI